MKNKPEYYNLLDLWQAMKQVITLMPDQGYSADTIRGVNMAVHVFYNRFKRLSTFNLHLRNYQLQKSLTRAEIELDDLREDNKVLKRRVKELER